MKVNVEMLAFMGPGTIRTVTLEDRTYADRKDLLEEIFRLGQNDFQPLECPSVSVGDVAILVEDGKEQFWLCRPTGWMQIDQERLDALRKQSALSRTSEDALRDHVFSMFPTTGE